MVPSSVTSKKTGGGGGGSPRLFLPKRRSREKLPEKQNESWVGRRRRPTKALQSFSIPFPRRNHFPPVFPPLSLLYSREEEKKASFVHLWRSGIPFLTSRGGEKRSNSSLPPLPSISLPTIPPSPLFGQSIGGGRGIRLLPSLGIYCLAVVAAGISRGVFCLHQGFSARAPLLGSRGWNLAPEF